METNSPIDLKVLSNPELVEFEALLVADYKAKRSDASFSTEDGVVATKAVTETITAVRAEMASRIEAAKSDEFVAATAGADFAAAVAPKVVEAAPVAAEVAPVVELAAEVAPVAKIEMPAVILSPSGIEGDKPAPVVAAAERKPLAKIAADVRGFKAGQDASDWNVVASAFMSRQPDLRSSEVTSGQRFLVASIEAEYPEDRILGDDAVINTRKVDAVTSQEAITASGGLCAPLTPWYNLQTYGDTCRPLRDVFPSYKADRGGISFVTPPKLSDLAGSTRRTTAAEDAAGYTNQTPPGTTAPKPCLHVICGTQSTCIVQAASMCLTFGNFGARTYPEQVEAWLKLARVEFARYQEQELFTALDAGSTQITAAQVYGANFSMIEHLGYAIDSFKSRYRICGSVNLRFVAPFWLKSILKNDIAAQGPGDGLGRYSISDAMVTDWFASRGVTVTWTQDTIASAGVPFIPIAAGPIGSYPTSVKTWLFPEGEWVYLDNGVLDLGLVRDSTLNSQNDYQVWMEEFNGLCKVGGIESLAITFDLCANGSAAPLAPALRTCP